MRCFYSPGYFVPLPQGHPFPVEKYPLTLRWLQKHAHSDAWFEKVTPLDLDTLCLVHDRDYLEDVRLDRLTPFKRNRLGLPHHPRFLERSQLDVAGTLAAARAALSEGIAWNLGGGTHHAMADEGLGFCVTNDIAVTVAVLKRETPELRILVLDTDAHQGNGSHRLLKGMEGVFTYSIHVGRNYPAKKEPGDCDVELAREADGMSYLNALDESLCRIERTHHFDLVLWVSGVDAHEADRFGQMKLTTADLLERDKRVITCAIRFDAALVGTLGGGYHMEKSQIPVMHGQCILNAAKIWRKWVG